MKLDEQQRTEAEAIANLAQVPFITTVNNAPMAFLPAGDGNWKREDLAEYLPNPLRKAGITSIHEVESFINVAKDQGSLSNTRIYLDVNYVTQKIVATAVFNDHGSDQAGWKDHKAIFTPRIGEEWRRWNEQNKKPMEQDTFANFLQDNIGDINGGKNSALPTGSDILTFVTKLEETRTVKFGSGVNLQNGMVQLEYTEEGDSNTKGKLDMFKEFGLALRPFFGGDPYAIEALLRYRIDRNTRDIKFWYELKRPDRVLEDASKELINKIKNETGFPVIYGAAPN